MDKSVADLFSAAGLEETAPRPLADRLRPQGIDDVVGQDHLLKPGGRLARMLASGRLTSMIFWGPPGTLRVLKYPQRAWRFSIRRGSKVLSTVIRG